MEPVRKDGRLRTVATAIWALPFVKKLVVIAIIAAFAKAGVEISPDVAAGILSVADAVEAGL